MNIQPETLPPDTPGQVSETRLRFRIFSALWAVASLFHMAHSSVFDSQLNFALLTLVALYTIIRPSIRAFVVLAALQVFDAMFRMPHTTNHWIFTAFVNLTILQSAVYLVASRRSFKVGEDAWFETFAPVVRVELIILYFFAAFHKLNAGFFTPASSCATELLEAQQIGLLFPVSPGWLAFNAYFTVVLEALIPLSLCFRRTRNIGILTGIIFHGILSYSTYNAFYDFSSMVMAIYFLFISPGFARSLQDTAENVRTRINTLFGKYELKKLAILIAIAFCALALTYLLSKKLDSFAAVHLYFFWTLYCFGFAALFLRFMLRQRGDGKAVTIFRPLPHWSFAIILLIVFLNGTCPYLGLKTESSYAMFSNLRTEGGISNHYLVPASWQVFGYQKDVVEIVSSTDPGLEKLASEQKAMVLFEFRNYVHERQPERVDYRLNGSPGTLMWGNTPVDPRMKEDPYVLAKLMKFRAFRVNEPQPCSH